tara:strand:+ start:467 stop:916 length:450 start_codon:yes stop_codon:yes gene_type:complete
MQEASSYIDLNDMMRTTHRLNEIMEFEISALKETKLANLKTYHEERLALIDKLEDYKSKLRRHPEVMKSFSKQTIETVRGQAKKMQVLADEGSMQLQKGRRIHAIIMDAVKYALNKHVSMSTGYNKHGHFDEGVKQESYIPPVSINESF